MYWVYENWRAQSKAVIHTAECGYCKNGQGCHDNPHGNAHGRWWGGFEVFKQADQKAKETGRPIIIHNCCKAMMILLLACLFLTGCDGSPEPTILERYPGPWHQEMDVSITEALIKNNIIGCGEYKYRESSKNKGEYLVYCSANGTNWTSYLVWTGTQRVLGPSMPDPLIPVE